MKLNNKCRWILYTDLIQHFLIENKNYLTKNGHVLLAVTAAEPVPSTLSMIADRAGGVGPLPQVAAGAGGVCLPKWDNPPKNMP
jgi:hypothetical protein